MATPCVSCRGSGTVAERYDDLGSRGCYPVPCDGCDGTGRQPAPPPSVLGVAQRLAILQPEVVARCLAGIPLDALIKLDEASAREWEAARSRAWASSPVALSDSMATEDT